jgi:hypothetical protein
MIKFIPFVISTWICLIFAVIYSVVGVGTAFSLVEGNIVVTAMQIISRGVLILWMATLVIQLSDFKALVVLLKRKRQSTPGETESAANYHKFEEE